MTKTQNSNCLGGMRCPRCKQIDRFYVIGSSLFEVTDDGSISHQDIEYEDDAYCRCPSCGWSGTVKESRELNMDEHEHIVEILIHRCHSDFRYLREIVEEHVENTFDRQEYQEFLEDFAEKHNVGTCEDDSEHAREVAQAVNAAFVAKVLETDPDDKAKRVAEGVVLAPSLKYYDD